LRNYPLILGCYWQFQGVFLPLNGGSDPRRQQPIARMLIIFPGMI